MTSPMGRADALAITLHAFGIAAATRVNTEPGHTMTDAARALVALGVDVRDLHRAMVAAVPTLGWALAVCEVPTIHAPHPVPGEDDTPHLHRLCPGVLDNDVMMVQTPTGGHKLLVHEPGYHDGEAFPDRSCMFCEGGLSACTRCDAFEGAWPDDCPGVQMTYEQREAVYAGTLNYRGGQWRDECCQIRRPADERLIEAGYRQVDGRWVKP